MLELEGINEYGYESTIIAALEFNAKGQTWVSN
jgi:hypothetical protein